MIPSTPKLLCQSVSFLPAKHDNDTMFLFLVGGLAAYLGFMSRLESASP